MNHRFGSLGVVLRVGVLLLPSLAVAQQAKAPKSDLVQYVRDAAKSGQSRAQVQAKATKAGWPVAAVRDAVAYVYGNPTQALAANNAEPPANPGPGNTPSAPPDTTRQTANNVAPPVQGKADPALSAPHAPAQNGAIGPAVPAGSAAAPRTGYEYKIGAGDVLQVSVWKEPEASANNVVVRPDGIISMALTKEIMVAGLTPAQAEQKITERLVKVIQEPDVTVVVTTINSKKIYAMGAVKKEGPISYTYSMTIMQAIAEAGGLTDYAKRKSIYVLRHENGKDSKLPFDYNQVLRGEHLESNVVMLPGDTLVVPH